jgi:hypothetical protein
MLFDDPAKLAPDEIREWFGFCSYGLNQTRRLCRDALPKGVVPPGISTDSLVELTPSEIDAYFDSCQRELDLFTILALIASIEAKIRMDAKKRYRTKGNKLSGRLLILFKEKKTKHLWKVPLYESGILEAWKWYIQIGLRISSSEKDRLIGKIGKFKELLRIRHWVAHGRYWPLQLNIKKYPPQLVCEAIEDLHGALENTALHGKLAAFL